MASTRSLMQGSSRILAAATAELHSPIRAESLVPACGPAMGLQRPLAQTEKVCCGALRGAAWGRGFGAGDPVSAFRRTGASKADLNEVPLSELSEKLRLPAQAPSRAPATPKKERDPRPQPAQPQPAQP